MDAATLWLIAGPDGVGKITFAFRHIRRLSGSADFVNRDEIAVARIARRVAEGGHHVPEADARRRFARSIANLPADAAPCDRWQLFDADPASPKIVAEGAGGAATFTGDLGGFPEALREAVAAFGPS